jgi:hypothetical protein
MSEHVMAAWYRQIRTAGPSAAALAQWRLPRVLGFPMVTAILYTVVQYTPQYVSVYAVHLCIFLSNLGAEEKGGNTRRCLGSCST